MQPTHRYVIILGVAACVGACEPSVNETLFVNLSPASTNISFSNNLSYSEEFNMIDYLYYFDGGGVAVGDINNDGLSDIYLVSNEQDNHLYLNKGDMNFEDIAFSAGVQSPGLWKTGVSMVDVNGDGWLDIYLCRLGTYKGVDGHNQLFINQGDLTFKEEAAQYNLDFKGFATQAAFFDMDRDGDLDVYLLNHSVHSATSFGDARLRLDQDTLAGDRLYRNDDNYFKDISSEAGIYQSQIGYGLGIALSDINSDGFTDIFIANDFAENDYLYLNNGDGTFKEVFTQWATHSSLSSMGCDIADYNNDGLADLVVLDMLPAQSALTKSIVGEDPGEIFRMKMNQGYMPQYKRNTLQLNRGHGHFSEVAMLAGIHATDWSWAPLFADFDNDGWKDLFISNGISGRPNDLDYLNYINREDVINSPDISDSTLLAQMPAGKVPNYFYRNTRDLGFENTSETWGVLPNLITQGVAYSDLDNDGDLDLVLNNTDTLAFIKQNRASEDSSKQYLSLQLQGIGGNTAAIGAKIEAYYGEQYQMLENYPTRGFKSSVDSRVHLGLGTAKVVDSLIINWPYGMQSRHYDLAANQFLKISAPAVDSSVLKSSHPPQLPLFKKITNHELGVDYKHNENTFIEFNREPLLPFTHSQEGPAVAIGDLNNDGLDDWFIGGAKHQSGSIYIQDNLGFRITTQPALQADRVAEDTDARFFDFDQDGDLDLLVVSGGNEFEGNSINRQPRLYINDGLANFNLLTGALDNVFQTGSCLAIYDFDGDGWQDLFLGSLAVPWNYGSAPKSYLLKNDEGTAFTDVSDLLPNQGLMGMVTAALWVDLHGEGAKSLVVAGEWMDLQILTWQNDGFLAKPLEGSAGFWKSLDYVDYDHDGDLDILGGNMGLNSIFKASKEAPLRLYLEDFDQNGTIDPLITHVNNGQESIFAARELLERQIPSIRTLFTSNQQYAQATIKQVIGKNPQVTHSIYELRSGVFINDNGELHFEPFDNALQTGFIRDFHILDIDLDGHNDILSAGNLFGANKQQGRYQANLGVVQTTLNAQKALPNKRTGLYLTGDLRKLERIEIKGEEYLMGIVNNDSILWFKRQP